MSKPKIAFVAALIAFLISACSLDLSEEPTFNIPKVDNIKIDADKSDWMNKGFKIDLFATKSGKLREKNDISADLTLAWSTEGIYIFADVRDDKIVLNPKDFLIWKNDCLSVFIGRDKGNAVRYQAIIAPPDGKEHDTRVKFADYRPIKTPSLKADVSGKLTDKGYVIEAFFPFKLLNYKAQSESKLGLNINIVDTDEIRDEERVDLNWYYHPSTHQNANDVYRIILSEEASEKSSVHAKAFVEEGTNLNICVYSKNPNDETIRMATDEGLIFEGTLKKKGDYYFVKHTMPYPKISQFSKSGKALGVALGKKHIATLDILRTPFLYEGKVLGFRDDIREFELETLNNPSLKGGVVFYGSSTIRLWKTLKKDMAPLNAINRGFGGSKMYQALAYTRHVIFPLKPTKIVLYEGDNDLAAGIPVNKILEGMKKFSEKVFAKFPNTHIYYMPPKICPSRMDTVSERKEIAKRLEEFAQVDERVHFIDINKGFILDGEGNPQEKYFLKDMLHFNEEGYKALTKLVRKELGL